MSKRKIKIGEQLYDPDQLSDTGVQCLSSMEFADKRIRELQNFFALLTRAKNSYISEIRNEMLSSKSGFIIDDE
jgi:hypothetical protein